MATNTINNKSSTINRKLLRWAVRETMGVIIAAVILMLAAERWDWLWGWVAVAVLAFWVIATALAVIPRHPQVLAERLGPRPDAKKWDTAIVSIIGVVILAVYLAAGLDVRYSWTTGFPISVQIIGTIAALIGYSVVVWATATNAFFSQNVRIQTERGHSVVTGGPYRFARHPGYFGSILAYLGTPVLLGSWWAIALGGITALLMIMRTALEDKTLQAELPGYQEYAMHVRYRLVPGLW